MSPYDSCPIERRVAIKWMLTAAASTALFDHRAFAVDGSPLNPIAATGYGSDPNLLKDYKPGDVWPLTFTGSQRATVSALCDVILPSDGGAPSASEVGVPGFLDEWISAPYPGQAADRRLILEGLEWIEAEAQSRFRVGFPAASDRQKQAICDDICFVPNAKTGFERPARFFKRFRDLTAGGYFTTREGMKDLGYTGNVPTVTFEGPPPEVLRRLGLA